MAVIPISCTVDICPPAENTTVAATGTAWSLNLTLMIWHPDLQHYETLMANKLARNEVEPFSYNARKYFQLAEDLVDYTLAMEQARMERVIAVLSLIVAIAIPILVVATGIIKILVGTLLLPLIALLVFQTRRRCLVRDMRRAAASNAEQRFRHFCETKRKKYMPA
jgi:hypothetical protein